MSDTTTAWDIRLEGLRLGYGEKVVLEDVTATLPAGRISMILGGSGCGKSTLLRHILGLQRPLSGRVLLGGNDLFALSGIEFRRTRRRMGVLFQDGALLGALTLGDNVALPLKEHTRLPATTIREVVLHTLGLVGLSDFADYYPSQLSGGMRKRAGLARAIVMHPPILLCDEPTSGLDPINAAQMDRLLLDMKAHFPEMTTVVVSHDLQSLRMIADHALVLHDGKAVFSGSYHDLQATRDPYLRDFLDRTPAADNAMRPALSPEVRAALDAWLAR
ncbi:ABC transporter ATP-binding protein [Nitratidesulfovibrio vulgaris]|jgi:phospholipid/cholesterol/gamma-HCH transport system ATP-binding protein|uniref:ABC transporter, ATP-binding protein n=2 Tax=Nitratidesulfovibrio vulgaris TaxID=881 RepID=Q72CN8_NITV2|nr:ABC transporter ATP-binding protein [Nitratidesulfovibrio vulgaris]GEB78993.1 ABC transporter ATP-binding protein [Desulfovibrio desulfuricans]HBW17213.1 ABC transporter ATP-binding protein [Desulfovibrio sp.]AAS95723.1 ABC transporter, ATP-binding protein [Nitratidesulfovibrio vulgaris str. Hildenborough]ABM28834.1 ABC transporter related protein [Nitratidesulfovibrio vulgaris DP4]ADP86308.1 ABC transporter related protein [Nitratidesulfovibrio vulgaris RCH1]